VVWPNIGENAVTLGAVQKVFDTTTTLARNHGNHGSFLARTTGTTGAV
jgi:hypothetical protein